MGGLFAWPEQLKFWPSVNVCEFSRKRRFLKILVTGCQRSGTRFYAKHLAKIEGIPYIDEDDFDVSDYDKLRGLLGPKESWCVHAPALKHYAERMKKAYPDIKIIWMIRDQAETVASMERIGWRRSAFAEMGILIKLLHSQMLLDSVWRSVYVAVQAMSERLGEIYESNGVVLMKDMSELESIEGFKKYGDTNTNISDG